ncbi:SCO family protein [Planctomicrobium piriforme]|uniref:Protein SCO1/2 n=1 Tax=Planctomicrobium piriforme TaxID=1576369 RepID=A0A1I3JFC0_9PLAN|nr:SCO family protein [Planctomicrobium piriforme]SFI58967.1 protein SCO1/2 [Planctomicrobium piriforme]
MSGPRTIWRSIATGLGALALLVCAASANTASAQAPPPDIGFDQNLGAQLPLDLKFQDENGETVELKSYFGKKPVVLMPVYYKCPMLCGLELNGLVRCLRGLNMSIGMTAEKDFEILTYSIDHREKPALATQKRRQYLAAYDCPAANDGWHFLTGDEESIKKLNEVIGFRTQYDEITGQYAHAAGLVVCTPDGMLSRYLYGVEFEPKDLRLAVVESSEGKVGGLSEHILLYCFRYDPASGKYGLAIMNFLRAGGVLTLLILGTAITMMLRKERGMMESHRLLEGSTHG